jgi:2C-methyl-D-erythritol 2,4-cyclodiphosphate synthase
MMNQSAYQQHLENQSLRFQEESLLLKKLNLEERAALSWLESDINPATLADMFFQKKGLLKQEYEYILKRICNLLDIQPIKINIRSTTNRYL